MIYNKGKLGKVKVKKVLEFGTGDILVGTCIDPNDPTFAIVTFAETEEGEINRPTEGFRRGKKLVSTDEVDTVMVFNKIASIDVVIKALENAKLLLTSEEALADFRKEVDKTKPINLRNKWN